MTSQELDLLKSMDKTLDAIHETLIAILSELRVKQSGGRMPDATLQLYSTDGIEVFYPDNTAKIIPLDTSRIVPVNKGTAQND